MRYGMLDYFQNGKKVLIMGGDESGVGMRL
jgi:hypothetical protein